jgi:hypothetical protein
MLEDETGVREIERPPFAVPQGRRGHIAAPEVEELVSLGARELLLAPLDADQTGPGGACHLQRQLGEAAAEVDDGGSRADGQLAHRGVIEELVEEGEPSLLGRRRAVQVGAFNGHRRRL